MTPGQIALAAEVWGWIKKASPTCLLVVCALGIGAYVYAGQTFATKESVDQLKVTISHGFGELAARMDLSDAESRLRELQAQVRQQEREIADLEMIVNEIADPASDSAALLRSRLFTARQDLADMRSRVKQAETELAEAQATYRRSRQ